MMNNYNFETAKYAGIFARVTYKEIYEINRFVNQQFERAVINNDSEKISEISDKFSAKCEWYARILESYGTNIRPYIPEIAEFICKIAENIRCMCFMPIMVPDNEFPYYREFMREFLK